MPPWRSRLLGVRQRGKRSDRRVFLLSGNVLDAYRWRQGRCEEALRFAADREGIESFAAFLAQEPPDPVNVLVDLVEEEFREDTVPRLIGPDRRALIEARRRRLFSDPTYGCSLRLGREGGGSRSERMLFTALTRPEKLKPWLQAIARNRVPLAGIQSLPLLTEQLLQWVRIETSPALVVTRQRAGGLRQTCFVDGRIKLSRLATPRSGAGDDVEFLRSEVEKLHRYLMRNGLLAAGQDLGVYIVSHPDGEESIRRLAPSSPSIHYRFVSLSEIGRRLGIVEAEDLLWSDRVFVSLLLRGAPGHQYAPVRETRGYALHRVRAGLGAVTLLVFGGGLLGGGSVLADAWDAARLARSLQAWADLYRQRYDEARARLPSIPVEVSALQVAVETAEGLRDARRTPDAMLAALSRCLDLQASIRIESIEWSAGDNHVTAWQPAQASSPASDSEAHRNAPGFARAPVFTLDVQGRIESFDGDWRRALEQVDEFADSLRAASGVVGVEVLSLPLDIGSGASLRGDAGARGGALEAPFELQLQWDPRAPL